MFNNFCLLFILQFVIVICLTGLFSMFTDGDVKKFFKRISSIAVSMIALLWLSYLILKTEIEEFINWIITNDNEKYFFDGLLYFLIFWCLVLLCSKTVPLIYTKIKKTLKSVNNRESEDKG